MSKDRRLGKGLAALLGTPQDAVSGSVSSSATDQHTAATEANTDVSSADHELRLNVNEIEDNPFQPRRDFSESELGSLAESLQEHDMLQPVLVRRLGQRYQLISGERRLRAAIKAGWKTIPARLREADDRLVAELAIVENLQRKDLNPIEKALSFKRYLNEHEATQEELANRLKIDRSTIANLMRLLDLPDEVQQAVRDGRISAGHARALLPLGDQPIQIEFSQRVTNDGLSVRATERAVQEYIQEEDEEKLDGLSTTNPKGTRRRNPQLTALEQELRRVLGTRIEIHTARSGRGRIVVHFANHAEFERIQGMLLDQEKTELRLHRG
ncbi:MAG: chromosome partitioning protein ParB [Planctomycetaceae bacterium]|nr:chromosome partitioning protein ParB [Planctomycetaceae bacterium]